MIDPSKAFDTLNRLILMKKEIELCGFIDATLAWFYSYLSEREQLVNIGESASNFRRMYVAVARGRPL